MRLNTQLAALATFTILASQSSAPSQVVRPGQPQPAGQQGKLPYDPPLASVPPMIQVFKSSDGGLYRTQEARVVGHSLKKGNPPILTLTLDARLPVADVFSLNTQLKRKADYDKMEFGPNSLTPIGLKAWSVEVRNVSGVRIGYVSEDSGSGFTGLPEKLPIEMTRTVTDGELESCTVRISLTYMFDGITINKGTVQSASKAFSGVVEQIYSPGMTVTQPSEQNFWRDWRPKPGSFVSRNSTQRLNAVFSSRVVLTNYGLQKGPELDVLLQTFKEMAKSVVSGSQDVAIKAQENYFVYTPGLGRLEIKPTTGVFKDFKEKSEAAYATSFKKVMEYEHKFAFDSGSFEKWYNSKNTQSSSSGSDSFDFSSLSKYGKFDVDTGSDYSFSSTYNELKSGEAASYLKLYNFLTSKQSVDTSTATNSARDWAGENIVEGGVANTVSLNMLKETYQQSDKDIEAVLVRFTGAVPVPYSRTTALTPQALPAPIDYKVTPIKGRTFHRCVSFIDPYVKPWLLDGGPAGILGVDNAGKYEMVFNTYNAANQLVRKTSLVVPVNALQFEVKDFYSGDGTLLGKRTGTITGNYILWDNDLLWYDGPVVPR